MKPSIAVLTLSVFCATTIDMAFGDNFHIIGERSACDKVISSDSGRRNVDSVQTIAVGHRYPREGGEGSDFVTAVEIWSSQESEEDTTYLITEGAIGANSINVVLTAKNTEALYYINLLCMATMERTGVAMLAAPRLKSRKSTRSCNMLVSFS